MMARVRQRRAYVLLLVCCCTSVYALDLYVSTSGTTTSDCTQQSPCSSIARAINLTAPAGNTTVLTNGLGPAPVDTMCRFPFEYNQTKYEACTDTDGTLARRIS